MYKQINIGLYSFKGDLFLNLKKTPLDTLKNKNNDIGDNRLSCHIS